MTSRETQALNRKHWDALINEVRGNSALMAEARKKFSVDNMASDFYLGFLNGMLHTAELLKSTDAVEATELALAAIMSLCIEYYQDACPRFISLSPYSNDNQG